MKKVVFIFLLLVINQITILAQEAWRLAQSEDNINVYVREVANSGYFAFKATMSVKTTESKVVKILKDADKFPEWFAFTASAKLLSQSEHEQIFFMETDYPWPYSNECMNYRMLFEKLQDNSLKISITGTNIGIHCDYSLKKASGYIVLEQEQEAIKITYYFHSEPSQGIPTWLINPRIHTMPFQTFQALRKKLAA